MRGRCIVQGQGNKAVGAHAGGRVWADGFGFDGFDAATVTPVPNEVFDVLLPVLRESELKALLYIARQTLGCDRSEVPISLDPFGGDGTTPNGHLEKACGGMDRALLKAALRSLLHRGVIAARKGPLGADGNPIVLYSLRFKTDLPGSGPGESAGGPPTASCPGYDMKVEGGLPGEAREADPEENMARVVGPLVEFGLSSQAAQHLAGRFPGPYILEKLSQVRAMVGAGSPLVSRNPQGYLRRAIEEDYMSSQRFGSAGAEGGPPAKAPGCEAEQGHRCTTPRASAKASAGELSRLWQEALGFLRSHVSRANFQVWLEETALLDLEEGQALVGSPTPLQRDWLEGRMRSLIKRALAEVLGREVEVAFAVMDGGEDSDET